MRNINEHIIIRVGPLHAEQKYTVMAEKEGFVLSRESNDSMSFRASKLGEIAVQVTCLIKIFNSYNGTNGMTSTNHFQKILTIESTISYCI